MQHSEQINQHHRVQVLILACGDISSRLPFLRAGCKCPALLPVHTKYLVTRVLEVYDKENLDLHLFVDEEFFDAVEMSVDLDQYGCKLHGLAATDSVVDTLHQACKFGTSAEVIVSVVTTLPLEVPVAGEVQVARMPRRGDWSAVSIVDKQLGFHPKGSSLPDQAYAFTGVFRSDRDLLLSALESSEGATDLVVVASKIEGLSPSSFSLGDWIDFGHEGNYHQSLARVINSRAFNSIVIENELGLVTKSSCDRAKLELEVNYVDGLPERLKLFFPRIFSRRNDVGGTESYQMEYYGYPCLSEYLLFWKLSEEAWWRCFEGLDAILTAFRRYPASVGPEAYSDFMFGKTQRRVEDFLGAGLGSEIRQSLINGVRINGVQTPGIEKVLEVLQEWVSRHYNESSFSILHGDFCFNNILFDHGSGLVRLIDPRGSFGSSFPGIYGDSRYDLAKLLHSSTGGYDYIVNGFYRLQGSGSDWSLNLASREADVWLGEMSSWLLGRHVEEHDFVSLMSASLFLSMCPLHADDSRRQLALFLNGLRLASKFV